MRLLSLCISSKAILRASVEIQREGFFLYDGGTVYANDEGLFPKSCVESIKGTRSEMKKYKFVLDMPEDGTVQLDIRKSYGDKKSIGHLVLSETGLGWRSVKKQKIDKQEICWDEVKNKLV